MRNIFIYICAVGPSYQRIWSADCTISFYIRDLSAMDFVIHRSPGTNPLWIPIDDRIRKLVPPISNQLLEKNVLLS